MKKFLSVLLTCCLLFSFSSPLMSWAEEAETASGALETTNQSMEIESVEVPELAEETEEVIISDETDETGEAVISDVNNETEESLENEETDLNEENLEPEEPLEEPEEEILEELVDTPEASPETGESSPPEFAPEVKLLAEQSGVCGVNLTWKLSTAGVFTISGTGAMYNYYGSDRPWKDFLSYIEEVKITAGATSVGEYAFYGCTYLDTVTIPYSVTSIGANAFENCKALEFLSMSQGLQTIGYEAFRGCIYLEIVTIPTTVTTIGNYAFYGCTALSTLSLSENLKTIGEYSFYNCSSLVNLAIPFGIEDIGSHAFYGCTALNTLSLPGSLKFIRSYAFAGCSSLKAVSIPSNVTEIGSYAFSNCTALSSLTLSYGLKTIYSYAFENCAALGTVKIPSSVNSLDSGAFKNCTSLKTLTLSEGLKTIGYQAFYGCKSLTALKIPASVNSLGEEAFRNCTSIQTLTLLEGLKTIGDSAFYSCTLLGSVVIPNSVNSLEAYAFNTCTSLKSVTLPSGLTAISNFAFANCSSLQAITIPATVLTIKDYAFYGTGLVSVTIPASVTSINYEAFYSCKSLKTAYFQGNAPSIGSYIFNDTTDGFTIYYLPNKTGWSTPTWNGYKALPNQSIIKVTGVKLDLNALKVYPGTSKQLVATVYPSNASDKRVTWRTNNSNVATVTSQGLVTTLAPGSATITVTTADGGFTATCKVTVVKPETGVRLNYTALKLYPGTSKQLLATVYPSDAYNKKITWRTSNSNVATVTSEGVVITKAPGNATITAKTVNGFTATCKVTVVKRVTGVGLSPASLSLNKGYSRQLTATVYPSDAYNKNLVWTTNNSSVATVNAQGVVTARANGKAVITVRTVDGGFIDTCQVTVGKKVTGVVLNYPALKLYPGVSKQLTATVSPSDASDKRVTWRSNNTNVATVTSQGVVTTKAYGSATITVTTVDGGFTDTCKVTVVKHVTGVKLNYPALKVYPGTSKQLIATVSPSDAYNKKVTWRTNNSNVATVTSQGVVTTKAPGIATITVKTVDGGFAATCKVTVVPRVTGVALNYPALKVYPGTSKQLIATVSPSDAYNKKVTWRTNNSNVAVVNTQGLVTTLAPGSATITVTTADGGFTATCKVTVVKKVTGVSLNLAYLTLNRGSSRQLIATVYPSDAYNKNLTWTTSNSSVATVNAQGLVVARASGNAVILVKTVDGGFTDTCQITVK